MLEPAVPSLAATLLLVRDGARGLEVLMGRRPPGGSFGGAIVFPGGGVEEADRDGTLTGLGAFADGQLRAAALRETAEEVGVLLTSPPSEWLPRLRGLPATGFYLTLREAGLRPAGERLHHISNWVTPTRLPRRFDTHFFVTAVDQTVEPSAGSSELVDACWMTPEDALESGRSGAAPMVLPTRFHLELLARLATVDGVMAHARSLAAVVPVMPRMVEGAGGWEPVLPGEPGYDEAEP